MQLVLVEGEDQLRGLIGSVNDTSGSISAPLGGYSGKKSAAWTMRFSSRDTAAIAAAVGLVLAM